MEERPRTWKQPVQICSGIAMEPAPIQDRTGCQGDTPEVIAEQYMIEEDIQRRRARKEENYRLLEQIRDENKQKLRRLQLPQWDVTEIRGVADVKPRAGTRTYDEYTTRPLTSTTSKSLAVVPVVHTPGLTMGTSGREEDSRLVQYKVDYPYSIVPDTPMEDPEEAPPRDILRHGEIGRGKPVRPLIEHSASHLLPSTYPHRDELSDPASELSTQ